MIIFLIISFFAVAGVSYAAPGTIDSSSFASRLCSNVDCSTGSSILWKTTNGTPVSITDTALTGTIWGANVGWINLAPTNGGVTNTTGGVLGGYAWGQHTGWINFAPTNGGVTINTSTGEFSGHAWAQNYGWIEFECPGASTCVKTDWRPDTNSYACSNSIDDDSDGRTDYPADSGCSSLTDTSEGSNPPPPPPPPPTPTDCVSLGNCPPPPDCSETNTCPLPPNCNETNTCPPQSCESLGNCPPPPDCSETNTCPPDEEEQDCSDTNTCEEQDEEDNEDQGDNTGEGSSSSGGGSLVSEIIPSLITDILPFVRETFATLALPIQDFFEVKNETATKIVSVTGLAAMAFSIPFSFWRTLLAIFGYRKRHPWGTVYDSVTKAPLDPAHVVLMDASGNMIATSLTDMDGRYGFSVNPGTYTLVANKTNYVFPSTKLAGRAFDEVYSDLYFGGPIVIESKNEVILKSIPLDPVGEGLSWNEQKKKEENMTKFFKAHSLLLARISLAVFAIGFVVSLFAFIGTPTILNGIVLGVYVLFFIARQIVFHLAPEGGVVNKTTGEPIGFAIITIKRPETGQVIAKKVTDASGHYYAIIQNGEYIVSIDRKNDDGTYETLHTESVSVKKGLLSKLFEI